MGIRTLNWSLQENLCTFLGPCRPVGRNILISSKGYGLHRGGLSWRSFPISEQKSGTRADKSFRVWDRAKWAVSWNVWRTQTWGDICGRGGWQNLRDWLHILPLQACKSQTPPQNTLGEHFTQLSMQGREMKPDGDEEVHAMWEILRQGEDFQVRVPVYMSGKDCIDHHHIDHIRNSGKCWCAFRFCHM